VIGLALFGIGLVVIWLFHLGVFGTYLTGFILGGVAYALRQS
jgi:hypothetical protein